MLRLPLLLLVRTMELPASMASLQLQESDGDKKPSESVEEGVKTPFSPSRNLRKRSRVTPFPINTLKRCKMNRKSPELTSEKEIVNYYTAVNKKWSVKQTNLETIYEEPKESSNGNVVTMSGAKVRRSIVFSGQVTKSKKAKRNAKVKKLQLCKFEKNKKLSNEEVKLWLAAAERYV